MLQNKIQTALQNAKNRGEDEGGFTLIELLVVILIIGILAAIALPTFLGQSDKAKDSSAKSDARNAVTQMESCLADETGSAITAVGTCAGLDEVTNNGKVTVTQTSGTVGYAIMATSDTTTTFTITKDTSSAPGVYTRTCSAPDKGGCGAASATSGTAGTW